MIIRMRPKPKPNKWQIAYAKYKEVKANRKPYVRRKGLDTAFELILLTGILLTIITIGVYKTPVKEYMNPVAEIKKVEEKVGKAIEPEKKAEAKIEFNLDGYIDELFGSRAWVVKNVIIKNESGWNPERENRGKAGYIKIKGRYKKYAGECSIGLAQINLKSDGCNGKKVHWDKVPGTSLDEKVEWLKVPKNNIYMMYIVSNNGTNLCPWSTYNGKECGRR